MAHQPQCRVAHRGGHTAHLPVAAFADDKLYPAVGHRLADANGRIARPKLRIGNALCLCGQGHPVLQLHAAPQLDERIIGNRALNLNAVDFGQLVPRIGNARLQPPVVGQDHQPFAVHIEPARGINPGHVDKVGQGRARRTGGSLVGKLRQDAKRFVEQNDARHPHPLAKPPEKGKSSYGCAHL